MESFFTPRRLSFGGPSKAPTPAIPNPNLDTKTAASLFDFSHPSFAGNLNVFTTSAWSFASPAQASAPCSPSPLRCSTSYRSFGTTPVPADTLTSLQKVKELSGDALDVATTQEPSLLIKDVKVLRIYVQLDELPFVLLDAVYIQSQASGSLRELHICIQSFLRPALQDIQNSYGLKLALTSTMRKWTTSNTVLKSFFLVPKGTFGPGYVDSSSYQEVDLWTAIAGLDEGSVELTDILRKAEGRLPIAQGAFNSTVGDVDDGDMMDLDDFL